MLSNFDAIARDRFKSLFLVIVLRSVNTYIQRRQMTGAST